MPISRRIIAFTSLECPESSPFKSRNTQLARSFSRGHPQNTTVAAMQYSEGIRALQKRKASGALALGGLGAFESIWKHSQKTQSSFCQFFGRETLGFLWGDPWKLLRDLWVLGVGLERHWEALVFLVGGAWELPRSFWGGFGNPWWTLGGLWKHWGALTWYPKLILADGCSEINAY